MTTRTRAALCAAVLLTDLTGADAGATASRTYLAGVCGASRYRVANVGGWNQSNEFVHTPNIVLTGSRQMCGFQDNWWFRPKQTLEINALDAHHRWRRVFRSFAACRLADGYAIRWCFI